MRTVAAIIEWKFDKAEGMRTRDLPDSSTEIFDWPGALGPKPSAPDLARWNGEMTAAGIPEDPEDEPSVDEMLTALLEQVAAPPGSLLEGVKQRRRR